MDDNNINVSQETIDFIAPKNEQEAEAEMDALNETVNALKKEAQKEHTYFYL